MRGLMLFLGLVAGFACGAVTDEDIRVQGRELSASYARGDTAAIWPRMTPVMQRFMRGPDAFASFNASVRKRYGTEQALVSESVTLKDGAQTYERVARWSLVDAPVHMQWAFDSEGRVDGFGVFDAPPDAAPAPTVAESDHVTRAVLHLPFDGEWHVARGGRKAEQNLHVAQPQQRFAYDLNIVRDGSSHRGTGESLADHYCWDQPIRAPARGEVVAVVDGKPDQAIGNLEQDDLPGNHVIVDLGNGEYALLAHVRAGSVRVRVGDKVEQGAELGRCGNSGNSSEPHLHFHLQDGPRLGEGAGLPAPFSDYVADGKPAARGEPTRNQLVRGAK